MTPIHPDAVIARRSELELNDAAAIPDFVIECFNDMIARNYIVDLGYATVNQSQVTNAIKTKLAGSDFDIKWLNVEPLFRNAGWKVSYHKAPYFETNTSYFTFTK